MKLCDTGSPLASGGPYSWITGGDPRHPANSSSLLNPDNTLLGRCTVAYVETFEATLHRAQARRAGVAAVLEHLAAELLVMNQRNERMSVHECARLLKDAAKEFTHA